MDEAAAPKQRKKYRVIVDGDVCDGCGVCIFFCKPNVFEFSRELSRRGSYPAMALRPEACTGCGLCDLGCPQLAIFVGPLEDIEEVLP